MLFKSTNTDAEWREKVCLQQMLLVQRDLQQERAGMRCVSAKKSEGGGMGGAGGGGCTERG